MIFWTVLYMRDKPPMSRSSCRDDGEYSVVRRVADIRASLCLSDARTPYIVPMLAMMCHAGCSVSLQCAKLKHRKLFDVVCFQELVLRYRKVVTPRRWPNQDWLIKQREKEELVGVWEYAWHRTIGNKAVRHEKRSEREKADHEQRNQKEFCHVATE